MIDRSPPPVITFIAVCSNFSDLLLFGTELIQFPKIGLNFIVEVNLCLYRQLPYYLHLALSVKQTNFHIRLDLVLNQKVGNMDIWQTISKLIDAHQELDMAIQLCVLRVSNCL